MHISPLVGGIAVSILRCPAGSSHGKCANICLTRTVCGPFVFFTMLQGQVRHTVLAEESCDWCRLGRSRLHRILFQPCDVVLALPSLPFHYPANAVTNACRLAWRVASAYAAQVQGGVSVEQVDAGSEPVGLLDCFIGKCLFFAGGSLYGGCRRSSVAISRTSCVSGG